MKYAIAALALLLSLSDAALAGGQGYSRGVSRRSSTAPVRRAHRPTVSRMPSRSQNTPAGAATGASPSGTNRTFTSRRSIVSGNRRGGGVGGANTSARSARGGREAFTSYRESAPGGLSRPRFRRAAPEEAEEEEGPAPVLGRKIVTSHPVWSVPGDSRIHETDAGNEFINPSRAVFHDVSSGRGVHWGAPDNISSSGASGNTGITARQ